MRSKIILDLGQRLPGPLATYTLGDMGYKIVKIEWENFRDPFAISIDEQDKTFLEWYEKMQAQKLLKVFSLNNPDHSQEWRQLLQQCIGIISSWPAQLKHSTQLDLHLKEHKGPLAYLEVESLRPMHDLNILAHTGTLKSHLFQHRDKSRIPPPFLPVAGICFGQNLALHLLDLLVEAVEQNTVVRKTLSLKESTERFSSIFAPSTLGPHNGLYPCYYIFRTQSQQHFLALALMEEKYWMRFVNKLKLPMQPKDRFCRDERVFGILEKAIGALTCEEASALSQELECISFLSL
ncbi:MAG: hypothetical protein A2X86_20720 [Bdellovibrionales bacterium GWA2_49_15]|nr:MAG: hypothetical protein A2X86_20720 [Bdellovibrionales bacterium GWA2_49_15]HAZ11260.1 hypothetical protein [Bdellovibrionales bacterium]